MLTNGLNDADMRKYLLRSPWFVDYSRELFEQQPEDMLQPLLDELLRSGAAYHKDGIWLPSAPFTVPAPEWLGRVMGL
jgi:hypothetical protein